METGQNDADKLHKVRLKTSISNAKRIKKMISCEIYEFVLSMNWFSVINFQC